MSKIDIRLVILIGLSIAVIVIAVVLHRLFEKPPIFPYQKKKYFLTPTEKAFFEVLLQIINNQYFIFPQVHIASILEVKPGQSKYMTYFNKIIRKSFDFVIFDKQNINAILVIELDDNSHNQPKRIERDNFVNEAVKVSGLNILHIKPHKDYDTQELSKQILSALSNPNVPFPTNQSSDI